MGLPHHSQANQVQNLLLRITMYHKHNLHEALLRLRARGPCFPTNGICNNLEYFLDGIFEERDIPDDAETVVREFMLYEARKWSKYSGCNTYPVPHPHWDPAECTTREYSDAANVAYTCLKDQAWDHTTTYGALRYELLEFLIERTKP